MNKELMELIELHDMLCTDYEFIDNMEYIEVWGRFDMLMKELKEISCQHETLVLVEEILKVQEQMSDCEEPFEYMYLWKELDTLMTTLKEVM